MFNSLETIAIIAIIIAQLFIAYHAFIQIEQTRSFLPKGRTSLTLKEYEVPADKILELEPFQVVDKDTYIVKKDVKNNDYLEQPRDEMGRFTSNTVYYPIDDDMEVVVLDE